MKERLATFLGRRVPLRGVDRVIRTLYPCRQDTRRFIHGPRRRRDHLLMDLDTRTLIDWSLLFHGDWEPHLGALFESLVRPGSTAIDIGANVGAHTLTLARLVGPGGQVLAFEPNPPIRDRLANNIALNRIGCVKVYDFALGATTGSMALMVPTASSDEAANPGLASLVALDTPHDLVTVPVRALDDVVADAGLQHVDVTKVDVQGYEAQVFQGMRETIRRFSPAIVFEYEDWAWREAGSTFGDVDQLFRRAGYSFWHIENRHGAMLTASKVRLVPTSADSTIGPHAELLAMRRSDPRLQALLTRFGASRG